MVRSLASPESRRTRASGFKLTLGVVGLALLGLAAAITAFSPAAGEILGPLGVLFGNGAAGLVMILKARSQAGRERLAWTMVGAGLLVAAFGVLVVGAIAAVTGAVPAFGPTDLIFITAYLVVLVGFGSLPAMPSEWPQRSRLLLDGLIGAISLGAVLWILFLSDLLHRLQEVSFWDRVVGTAYPGLDVAMLIMVMIVIIQRSNFRFDVRLILFGLALVLQAVADLSFLATGVGQTFQETDPYFPAFILAAACFLGTGLILHLRPRPREYAERQTSWWAMLAPYSAAAVLLVLLVRRFDDLAAPLETRLLFYAAVVVGALVVIRQAVAIRENRILVEHQRSAMVSSISHELRTPLTAMVGFLSLLKDDEADLSEEERWDMTAVVHQQAVYMSRIVSDLIMLARRSPSTVILEEAEVSVRALVESAIRTLETDRGSFVVEVPIGLTALVDPDRMQQALVNLMSNAIRYGGSERLVRARVDGTDNLVIEVHDDGPGVLRKYELAIWDRFERGAHRLNATVAGSGIGLAVVDTIVRAHGGVAHYSRSEELGGACFTMLLPRRVVVGSGVWLLPGTLAGDHARPGASEVAG